MATVVNGRLGAGEYRIQIQHRPRYGSQGTTQIGNQGELTTTRIFWSRNLDETSEASVVVPVKGFGAQTCCDILRDVIPLVHELVIYRNETPVWIGPIITMTYSDDEVRIEAKDLTWWLNHRVPRVARNFQQSDLSTIFETLINDAQDIEYFGLLTDINPAGIKGDREIKINEYKYFGDHIRELGRTGIDWTVYLRKIYAGGYTVPNATPIATLKSSHFKNGYEISLRGDIMCSNAIVKGSGEIATAEWAVENHQFGHVDAVWEENGIKDYNSALQAAKTRWDMLRKPVLFFRNPRRLETGFAADELSSTNVAILTQDAPVVIESLIPGATVSLDVDYLCQQIQFLMRLKRVSVTVENNESVELGLIPVGTSNEESTRIGVA